ncbi:hypothetical protein KM1_090110 [Entamoeba histolytica HM-3:IMSS]|uniref:Uncharacterized protein n=1 Tax=Entamoeba histolytica HM-3:IMSS TaxID=885315 RepID=M7W5V0_ENTHI|nr:hypothetical protein KM1_090110 [Entamoeba histolytica HM-3:IMSS]
MLQPYFIVTWICGIFLSGVELVIVLFHCLCIVDIQTDQLSPVDFCKRVNPFIIPPMLKQNTQRNEHIQNSIPIELVSINTAIGGQNIHKQNIINLLYTINNFKKWIMS